MSAPILWGIDPDALYAWTPRAGRTVVKAAEYEGDKLLIPAEYGSPLEGAPVFLLRPTSEGMRLRLTAAQDAYYRALARSAASVRAGGSAESAIESTLEKADEVYSDELIASSVGEALAGWRGLKTSGGREIVFSGDWEKDRRKFPISWRIELFRDLINETAYSKEDVEGFTSPQGSPSA